MSVFTPCGDYRCKLCLDLSFAPAHSTTKLLQTRLEVVTGVIYTGISFYDTDELPVSLASGLVGQSHLSTFGSQA